MRFNTNGEVGRDYRGAATACWLDGDRVLTQRPHTSNPDGPWDTIARHVRTGEVTVLRSSGAHALAGANGRWMRRLDALDGSEPWTPTDGYVGDMDGDIALTADKDARMISVFVDGAKLRDLAIGVPFGPVRLKGSIMTWVEFPGPTVQARYVLSDTPIPIKTLGDRHYTAIVFEHPTKGKWVLYQAESAQGLSVGGVCHRIDDPTRGYRFGTPMSLYDPDCLIEGEGVRIGWSNDPGQMSVGQLVIPVLGEAMVPLEMPTPPPPPRPIGPTSDPLPEGTEIDLTPFWTYDPAVWPRGGDRSTGDEHAMDMQAVTHRGEPCWWFAVFGDHGKGRLGSLVQLKNGMVHLLADLHNRDNTGHPDGPFINTWNTTGWLPLKMRIGRQYAYHPPDHVVLQHREDGTVFNQMGGSKEHWVHAVWPKFWCGPDLGERMVARIAENNTGVQAGQTTDIPGLGMESTFWVLGAGRTRWTYDRAMDVFVGPNHSLVFPDPPMHQSDFWHVGGPRYAPNIPEWIPLATEAPPVSTRPMTAVEKNVVLAYAGAHPLPHGDGSEAFLDRAYRNLPDGWLAKLAQQLRFSLGENYGHKRRGPGAPLSAGTFAVREGNAMQCFDILVGAGTGTPRLDVNVESMYVTDQEFVPVTPVNHLDLKPPTDRPTIALPFWGATAFDLAEAVRKGDWRYYDLLKASKLVPRVNVYATINHSATGRHYRDFATGLASTRVLLQKMVQDGVRGQFILLCGTGPDADNTSRAQALDMIRQENALFAQFPAAVAGLQIGNENYYPGLEQPYMWDAGFLAEADALIDKRFPLAWGAGHGGQPVNMAGGSYLVHHSDRGLSPEDAAKILAEASALAKRPVIDDEPRRIESGGSGQATGDLAFVRRQIALAKQYRYGFTLHIAAGRGCNVDLLDDVQRAALDLVAVEAGSQPVPAPPPPSSILDADMTVDAIWYPIFVNRSGELRAAIIAEYTRIMGHGPAESDIQHNLWRACVERLRWRTMRRAMSGRED